MLTVSDLIHLLAEMPSDAIVVTRAHTPFSEAIEPIGNVELSEGWSDGNPRVLVWA